MQPRRGRTPSVLQPVRALRPREGGGRARQVGFGTGTARHPHEGVWCHNRPHACRPPLPAAGDRVLYRGNEWAVPVGATVVAVLSERRADKNLWNPDGTPRPDPWPKLKLYVEGPPAFYVLCREARLEGSPGWLPLDWQRWLRPTPGRPIPGIRGA